MNRTDSLRAIKQSEQVDVLIIGGGINGVGTFRDLALQGVNVVLVERGDFASGASSASSHMVHGGIRYLENGEFRLVREAVRERNRLIRNAPQYVKPLPTTIPIFKWGSGLLNAPLKFLNLLNRPSERGAVVIKAGLMMYDAYTKDDTVPKHDFDLKKKTLNNYPDLHPDVLCTATYYDGAMKMPERILLELLRDGVSDCPDAWAINYMSAINLDDGEVELRDELTEETLRIRPKLVINAAGPWIDTVNQSLDEPTHFIGGTKGSHIVVDNPKLRFAIRDHEFFFENSDGRIVLIYPFQDKVILGTSDIRIDDPDDAYCTDEEIDYFFALVERIFPDIKVTHDQVVHRFSGVRPLPASDAKTTGQVSRDHSNRIIAPNKTHQFAIFNLIGGKWTSYRAFSEEATDRTLEYLGMTRKASTADLPIGGGYRFNSDAHRAAWIDRVTAKTGAERRWVATWLDRYGLRAEEMAYFSAEQPVTDAPLVHHPRYSRHEITYLATHEMIAHLEDLLLRRVIVGKLGEVTTALLAEVAALVGAVNGWGAERQAAEVDHALAYFAEKHQPIKGDMPPSFDSSIWEKVTPPVPVT